MGIYVYEIDKNNLKIDGNEITIQNNGIEITFEIKMMPDEGNMEYENKQISCSIISCDFAKNIAINYFIHQINGLRKMAIAQKIVGILDSLI